MGIRGLRLLVVLAQAGTLTTAASELGVSRQAVAKLLERTESEFGERLFERRAGRFVPTDFGKAVVADARDVVERYDDFCQDYMRPLGGESRVGLPVSVALVNGGSQGLPESFFERYAMMRPKARLEVEEMSTDAVLDAVSGREADVGIVGSHPELLAGFEACSIQPMGIWLLAPQAHRLARQAVSGTSALDLADLDGAPLVTAGRHNHLHRFVMGRCEEAGVTPEIRAVASDAATLLGLVRELGALCFGFPPNIAPPPEGFVAVRLAVRGGDDFGTYAIRLSRARNQGAHHPEARHFWRYIQAYEGAAGLAWGRRSRG